MEQLFLCMELKAKHLVAVQFYLNLSLPLECAAFFLHTVLVCGKHSVISGCRHGTSMKCCFVIFEQTPWEMHLSLEAHPGQNRCKVYLSLSETGEIH